MNLSNISSSWYGRYFLWSVDFITDYFSNWGAYKNSVYYRLYGTNLCQFFRVLFYVPCIILAHILVYGLLIYTLIIYPITHFPLSSIATLIISILLGILLFVGFVYLSVKFGPSIGKFFPWLGNKTLDAAEFVGRTGAKLGVPIVIIFVKDKHHKICRKIGFGET